jgi:hypothetical protein
MEHLINFLSGWVDLITVVFTEHTFTAAIMTIIGVGVFFKLDKPNIFQDKVETGKNAFIVLLGWAIFVPILGWVAGLVGDLYDFIKFLVGLFLDLIKFIYAKFEQQPFVVIVIVVISAAIPAIWGKFMRFEPPALQTRVIASIAVFVILVALIVPVVNKINLKGIPLNRDSTETQQGAPGDASNAAHH